MAARKRDSKGRFVSADWDGPYFVTDKRGTRRAFSGQGKPMSVDRAVGAYSRHEKVVAVREFVDEAETEYGLSRSDARALYYELRDEYGETPEPSWLAEDDEVYEYIAERIDTGEYEIESIPAQVVEAMADLGLVDDWLDVGVEIEVSVSLEYE